MPIRRGLSRKSSHRIALLRNMVTSLIEQESIQTSWHKAKEAQKMAEKVITLAKKNTEASRRRAHQILFRPTELLPKLFTDLRLRYETRPGGYTRVLRTESHKDDQAPSAILELVDSPSDTRFASTALTLARMRRESLPMNDITSLNVAKVTQFRPGGTADLEKLVAEFEGIGRRGVDTTMDPVEVLLDGREPKQQRAGVSRQVRLGFREVRDTRPGAYNRQRVRDDRKLKEIGGAKYFAGGRKQARNDVRGEGEEEEA